MDPISVNSKTKENIHIFPNLTPLVGEVSANKYGNEPSGSKKKFREILEWLHNPWPLE
jgi:hypothetical protein